MARRKKKLEEGEVEANLIPVMNVMFLMIPALLLAMEVARFAAIAVSPPKYAAKADQKEEQEKKEKPLDFKVFIMEDGYRVSASGQQEGAEAGTEADSSRPSIPLKTPGAPLDEYDRYAYDKLEAKAKELKSAYPKEFTATVSAENSIPFQVMIGTMDALRGGECKELDPQGGKVPDTCLFWNVIIEAGSG